MVDIGSFYPQILQSEHAKHGKTEEKRAYMFQPYRPKIKLIVYI